MNLSSDFDSLTLTLPWSPVPESRGVVTKSPLSCTLLEALENQLHVLSNSVFPCPLRSSPSLIGLPSLILLLFTL